MGYPSQFEGVVVNDKAIISLEAVKSHNLNSTFNLLFFTESFPVTNA